MLLADVEDLIEREIIFLLGTVAKFCHSMLRSHHLIVVSSQLLDSAVKLIKRGNYKANDDFFVWKIRLRLDCKLTMSQVDTIC
ncbi:hypothetical protein CHUAL_009150 [Chamberlinius hualienensis]